ncbi:hypothetical protein EXW28_07715 [Bacillus mycoides]|uniref:tyrosine-type recombinase/integrase n=1 Tax=Bacillus mycoides TaxID=1405 RepID=UPI001C012B18|nr:tyrosine-type recombinase/integrase [Bacillus mycoides]QWG49750.1 hypothetical protein EXW37_07715 [Bacillus mycoides]QWH33555.1 hypothetical protein EXW28_07715 [Bacillus mycoides]
MNTPIQHQNQNVLFVSNTPIELGVKRHFNSLERTILNKKIYIDSLFDIPIDYYTNFKILTRQEISYAYKLAFFQRIQLSLDDTLRSPVSANHYPIDQLDNFTKLDDLFEKHFNSFDVINSKLPNYKKRFKKLVLQTVFKLWLSGYGILQGYSLKTVSNNEIEHLMHKNKKLARFLATILIDEPLSQITFIPDTYERISVLDSEKVKWTNFRQKNNYEITQELFDFTFKVLQGKANGGYILTYSNSTGALRRKFFSKIRWGTFRAYSSALLTFTELLLKKNCYSIEQAISGSIIDTLSSQQYHHLQNNIQKNIRINLRTWLEYYTKTNVIALNIDRIIPMSVSNKERSYGKTLHFGSVHSLISTLLDDQSNVFDENKLFDLRARRACLIQLATGKRISEVLTLKKQCLKTDSEGNVYIHFHKTKNGVPHTLPATKDIIHWVQQLQIVAPNKKIQISSEEYTFGDDEADYRLIANIHNDGPLVPSSINKFLKKIQKKLWSNINSYQYYSSHDLRRMTAVYMKIKGKSKADIQEQLGQLNINSQHTYLETKPPEIQKHFKEIAEDGIWNHLVELPKELQENVQFETEVHLEQTLQRAQKQNLTLKSKESAQQFLEEIISKVDIQTKKLPNNSSKQPTSTGFPIRTNNCLATEIVNCGHTELHCFSCKRYLPDSNKLDEHKAEILRYILLLFHNEELAKKNKLEREIIVLRSKDIKNLLNETFQYLFKKFNLNLKETKSIEQNLYSMAKKYYRKYKKEKPTLSYGEALIFLRSGVINDKQ